MSAQSGQQDDYGFFGPNYAFDNSIPLPGEIGVKKEPTFDGIFSGVQGLNYYLDTIAFGGPTFFDNNNPEPLGIRYFLNTGMRCSNGATMSEYYDGVTKGDLLGERVAQGLASAGLPSLRGLGPGILENARDALDPRPLFSAISGTGYPVCQQVTCPVGDVQGRLKDAATGAPVIQGDVEWVDGLPRQRRWVQAYDADGTAFQVTKDEFAAQPKCYNADGTYMARPPDGCPAGAAADTAVQGAGRYGLCTVTQPAVLPGSVEGFDGASVTGDELTAALVIAGLAVLGGAMWWGLQRRR
jgi:LPXTG-motif cell wall-anchored protein